MAVLMTVLESLPFPSCLSITTLRTESAGSTFMSTGKQRAWLFQPLALDSIIKIIKQEGHRDIKKREGESATAVI